MPQLLRNRTPMRIENSMRKMSIAAIVAILPALAACGEKAQTPAAAPPPPVTIAKPTSKMIADQDEYVGRFVAVEPAGVGGGVPGYREAIHFQDGKIVKAGALPYLAALKMDPPQIPGTPRPHLDGLDGHEAADILVL